MMANNNKVNNEFEFTGFEDIFYGYNMGESISKRTRKVTITEITEDSDDWSFVDDDIEADDGEMDDEEGINTDEVYQLLDDLVQDWKIKLEFIVGDGLKKLRKSTKEKKTMTKYLPGEFSNKGHGKINEAKNMILKEWKNEFNKIIQSTKTKLEKLATEKVKENEELYRNNNKSTNKRELINSGKKTYINIDCNTGGGFHNLKELMRELDKLTDPMRHHIPCYNQAGGVPNWSLVKRGCTEMVPSYNTNRWMYDLKNLNNIQDQMIADLYHSITPKENQYQNILESFQISHYNNKKNNQDKVNIPAVKAKASKPKKVVAGVKKSTSVSCIKEQKKVNNNPLTKSSSSFNLMEYQTKKGETKCLVVKRKAKSTENIDAEDIYQDWLKATEGRRAIRKPRTRKLSHKSMRKEIIRKAEEENQPIGPLTYSDILKKNLKLRNTYEPVEDIFEAFRDYIKELNSYIESPPSSPTPPSTVESTNVGTVKVSYNVRKRIGGPCKIGKKSRKISKKFVMGCLPDNAAKVIRGSKQTPLPENNDELKVIKRPRKYATETIFNNWRHNLIEPIVEKPNYQMEAYFGSWRRNFHEKTPVMIQQQQPKLKVLQPETIFSDWVHNLMDKDSYFDLKRTASKRQSRKNKNKNNSIHEEAATPQSFKKLEMPEDGIPHLKEDHHGQKKKNQKNHRKQKLD